ncbi:MAG: right-handed parallel beta-helix repeat-containing protein [Haloarculaceae archaeon]
MPTNDDSKNMENDSLTEQNTDPTAEKETLIGRRSLLKSTAAAVAATTVAGMATSSASAADYETIKVPAGETENISLGSGDTLENVLIDVTANGASVSIRASGDGWAIRNVGVKGEINVESPKKIFVPSVPEGGSAIVENFYLGDGTGLTDASRLGGVWVNANKPHEGELIFRRVNIGGWADNGLYGSGPGAQEGPNAGTVKIEQSYAHNNNISGFRIGTNGSYVKDSTIVVNEPVSPVPAGTNARGIYMKEGATMVVENCDISMSGSDGTHAVIAADGAEALVRDCRVDGPLSGNIGEETNVSNNPSTEPPEGVPLTAEEAAGDTAGSSSSNEDSSEETSEPDFPNTLTVETESGGPLVEYEFTIDGTVAKGPAAEGNDTLSENGDGTTTVTGVTGNGYADDFQYNGELADWSASVDSSDYTLLVNGDEVDTSAQSVNERLLSIETQEGGPLVEYEFTVDGTVTKGPEAESNDSITANGDGTTTVTGVTGNGYTDDFAVVGDITGWSANVDSSDYTILIDGTSVSPDSL